MDVDSEYTGVVIDRLTGSRRGVMMEMKDAHEGKVSQFVRSHFSQRFRSTLRSSPRLAVCQHRATRKCSPTLTPPRHARLS